MNNELNELEPILRKLCLDIGIHIACVFDLNLVDIG